MPLDNDGQVFLRETWEDTAFEEHKAGENIRKPAAMKDRYGITTSIVISRPD